MRTTEHAPARDPQDLERFLVSRQRAGDIEGMVALFEPDAVIETDDGRVVRGHAEMRTYYREIASAGRTFVMGEQQDALVNGRPGSYVDAVDERQRDCRGRPTPTRRFLAMDHRPIRDRPGRA